MSPIADLAVVDAPVADLHPHPRNPRKITPARLEQLQATLEAERDMLHARPLIALLDGTVVAGNQRLAAAVALGWETIPTVYADLDQAQQTRWMLLDNRGFGEDVEADVAVLLAELAEQGSDLALTGYDPADLDRLLASLNVTTADPDAAPPVPTEAKSVRGQVYELGPHRLMCGDATDQADVAALVGPCGPMAVMVTDPPYGVGVDHTWRDAARLNEGFAPARSGTVANDDRHHWADAYRLTDAPVAYVWHSALYGGDVQADLLEVGYEVRQQIVWVKTVHALGRAAYQWKHETCWYAVRKGATASWLGGRKQSTVWEAASPIMAYGGGQDDQRTPHPTQKPLAVTEPSIVNHSERGDWVYDPFAGSGTTLIACEASGRRAAVMEIDPAYCDVVRQRYADYVGDQSFAP